MQFSPYISGFMPGENQQERDTYNTSIYGGGGSSMTDSPDPSFAFKEGYRFGLPQYQTTAASTNPAVSNPLASGQRINASTYQAPPSYAAPTPTATDATSQYNWVQDAEGKWKNYITGATSYTKPQTVDQTFTDIVDKGKAERRQGEAQMAVNTIDRLKYSGTGIESPTGYTQYLKKNKQVSGLEPAVSKWMQNAMLWS